MSALFERWRGWLDLVATVAMIVTAGVILTSWLRGSPVIGNAPAETAFEIDISAERLKITPSVLQRYGSPSAKMMVIEFADFECPYCASYASTTLPRVRAELVDKNVISYAFMHYPLDQIHKRARPAAIAAVCASRQDKFWEMHHFLFENRGTATSAAILEKDVAGILDTNRYEQCLKDAEPVVDAQLADGKRLGVIGTPTFFVGEVLPGGEVALKARLNGAVQFDAIAAAVKAASGL
jgi:protein-disulfide isomerase